jgi:outer membrane protein assembly factor BamB
MQFNALCAIILLFALNGLPGKVNSQPTTMQRLPEAWRLGVSNTTFLSPPVLNNEQIIFKDTNGKLRCVSIETGKLIWEYSRANSSYICGFDVKDDVVYVADGESTYALRASNGTLLWSIESKRSHCGGIAVLGKYVITSPNPGKGVLSAYDLKSGKLAWERNLGIYLQEWVVADESSNLLLLPTYTDSMFVINGTNGSLIRKIKGRPYDNQAGLQDGKIYCADFSSKKILAINIHSGETLWSTPQQAGNLQVINDRVIIDQIIYHEETKRYTYHIRCFSTAGGKLLWEKSSATITDLLPCNLPGKFVFVRHQSIEEGEVLALYNIENGALAYKFSLDQIGLKYVFLYKDKMLLGNSIYSGYFVCYKFKK